MVKCKICDKECNSITHHVINNHREEMTVKQYYDKFEKKPNEGICKRCGKETKLVKFSKGYRDYCSSKCSTSSKEVQQKAKETYFERTGYTHTRHNPEAEAKLRATNLEKYGKEYFFATKESVDKIKNTNLERYGDTCALRVDSIKEKTKETNLKKYGVDNVFKSEEIKEKIYLKNIEKYGFKSPIQNTEIKEKSRDRLNEVRDVSYKKSLKTRKAIHDKRRTSFFESFGYTYIDYKDDYYSFTCKDGHESSMFRGTLKLRLKNKSELCVVCNPFLVNTSKPEKELQEFIKENYQGTIEENTKQVMYPQELDIYLPELKLAFEFNGVYWHNELNKPNDYHFSKTNRCEHKGIKLVHIYEDDWYYKNDTIKSSILELLNKNPILDIKNYKISEVSDLESKKFVLENSLKHEIASRINLGLYVDSKLVSLMSFNRLSYKNFPLNSYNLVRFCNKNYLSIPNSFDILLKEFLKSVSSGSKIVSFVDRGNSNEEYFKRNGFKEVNRSEPEYQYVVDGIRTYKANFSKSELVKAGFDSTKTEHQIMLEREIYRIYDSGSLKFEYLKP